MTENISNEGKDSKNIELRKNHDVIPNLKPQIVSGGFKLWAVVMVMYVFLFSSIGYIAFWSQGFNDPDQYLKGFVSVWKSYNSDDISPSDKEKFEAFVIEAMKAASNSAGDLQELASQSFNIVLGSFLAFLSATATLIFQNRIQPANPKKD